MIGTAGRGRRAAFCVHEDHASASEPRCRFLKFLWGRGHEAPALDLSCSRALFCRRSVVCVCVRVRACAQAVCCLDIVTPPKGRRWLLGINAAQMLN